MLQVKYTIFNVKEINLFTVCWQGRTMTNDCDCVIFVNWLVFRNSDSMSYKEKGCVLLFSEPFIIERTEIALREVGCRFPDVSCHKDENDEEEEKESDPVHHLSQEVPACDDLPCRRSRCLRVGLQPGRNNMGWDLACKYRDGWAEVEREVKTFKLSVYKISNITARIY